MMFAINTRLTRVSGIMGYSADGFPLVGEIPREEGLYISASFQGHGKCQQRQNYAGAWTDRRLGMVLCFLCAKALTEMMLGNDGEELQSWFPNAFRVSQKRLEVKFEDKLQWSRRTWSSKPKSYELSSEYSSLHRLLLSLCSTTLPLLVIV